MKEFRLQRGKIHGACVQSSSTLGRQQQQELRACTWRLIIPVKGTLVSAGRRRRSGESYVLMMSHEELSSQQQDYHRAASELTKRKRHRGENSEKIFFFLVDF